MLEHWGYPEKTAWRFSEGILLFCCMGEILPGDLQKLVLQRSLSSGVRNTFHVPTYGCAYRKGSLTSWKYFVPWMTGKRHGPFFFDNIWRCCCNLYIFTILPVTTLEEVLLAYEAFLKLYFKTFGSSSSGSPGSFWRSLLIAEQSHSLLMRRAGDGGVLLFRGIDGAMHRPIYLRLKVFLDTPWN